jgi:hypothetical protein
MKLRIGFLTIGFLSLALSLDQMAFATTPTHLSISGAAFICADQEATGACPNAEFDTATGIINNGQGTLAANVSLPQGATVNDLWLCGQFNEDGSSITATLYRTPLTAPSGLPVAVAMATISSTGAANETQCFKTGRITDAVIDNTTNQYYVGVVVPDNDGVLFNSVQILYTPAT